MTIAFTKRSITYNNLVLIIHCLRKNAPTLTSCSFDKHGLILMIFSQQHPHTFKMICISDFITGMPSCSHAGIVFTQWSKNGFLAPQGIAPINVKFGTGERTAGPLPLAKFHVYRGKNVWTQPPKLSKFRMLAINFSLRGHSFQSFAQFLQIFSFCTRLR